MKTWDKPGFSPYLHSGSLDFTGACPWDKPGEIPGTIPGTKGGTESLCEKNLCAFLLAGGVTVTGAFENI